MGWKPAQAWTSQEAVGGYRHFRMVMQGGRGNERWVELEAVLDASTRRRIAWRDLCDREQWSSGWQQIPPQETVETSTPERPEADADPSSHNNAKASQ
jgi:tryptophan-rich hypothetical protein